MKSKTFKNSHQGLYATRETGPTIHKKQDFHGKGQIEICYNVLLEIACLQQQKLE